MSNQHILIAKAITKAVSDSDFKKHLIQNTLEAISSLDEGNFEMPDGKEIYFIDNSDPNFSSELLVQTEKSLTVSIPERLDFTEIQLTAEIELTEAQLDSIVGGGDAWCSFKQAVGKVLIEIGNALANDEC
jgi:hypothetical protein